MVLCLSPSWASRVPSESSPGAWSLLLSRGVSFKAGGHSALETFVPPRRANYVTGTFAPADPEGGWVGELARDLDCPTGGSVPLAHRLQDTLVARWVLAARANLPVPPTLAFVLGARGDLPAESPAPGVRLVRLQDPQDQHSLVQEEVGAFLGGAAMEPYSQVGTGAAGGVGGTGGHWGARRGARVPAGGGVAVGVATGWHWGGVRWQGRVQVEGWHKVTQGWLLGWHQVTRGDTEVHAGGGAAGGVAVVGDRHPQHPQEGGGGGGGAGGG